MFAYDLIKSNPQLYGSMVNNDWYTLFTDKSVDRLVKEELVALQSLDCTINDAVLYFNKQWKLDSLTALTIKHAPLTENIIQYTKFLTLLYSVLQNHSDLERTIVATFFHIEEWMVRNIAWTYDDAERFVIKYAEHDNLDYALLFAFCDDMRNNPTSRLFGLSVRGSPSIAVYRLFAYMDTCYIRTATYNSIRNVLELVDDVDVPAVRFTSFNQLHAAHDARTERMIQKDIEKVAGNNFKYHPLFVEIVERHGFKLPMNRGDMIRRGKQHHNCVATYADRQMKSYNKQGDSDVQQQFSRVVMNDIGTCEFKCYCLFGLINMVETVQYKGVNNTNLSRTRKLVELQIALTGQPADILCVTEDWDGTVQMQA